MDISIALFANCNHNCAFCYNGISKLTNDYMKFDENKYIEAIQYYANKANGEALSLELIGGELFTNEYKYNSMKLHRFIMDVCNRFNIRKINFTSNLMFTDKSIINNIIATLNYTRIFVPEVSLGTSLDISWRFKTLDDFSIYKRNFILMEKALKKNGYNKLGISMILAERPMKIFISEFVPNAKTVEYKVSRFLEKVLKQKHEIYAEILEPMNKNWECQVPTYETTYQFFDLIIRKGM